MSTYLLDVNVLVALTWPTHVHHPDALAWFDQVGGTSWATCPITQLGFVRVSANPKINRDAVRPAEAVAVLKQLTEQPGHHFWPDELPVIDASSFNALSLIGHRQVTDAYLLTLAEQHGGKVATFDRGVATLIADPQRRSARVEIISQDGHRVQH